MLQTCMNKIFDYKMCMYYAVSTVAFNMHML
jgi:hypothetical protein